MNKIMAILVMIPFIGFSQVDPARVLFAETRGCTEEEKMLVAAVMHNRIGKVEFGNYKTIEGVVSQKKAFSCVGSKRNKNWMAWNSLPQALKVDWDTLVRTPDLNDEVVFYHDKTIYHEPYKWVDRRYFMTYVVKETKHFKFYGIRPIPNLAKVKSKVRRKKG